MATFPVSLLGDLNNSGEFIINPSQMRDEAFNY